MNPESWQANVEELLALQSILQTGLVCFVDGSDSLIDDATAEQLLQQGCRSRNLSCNASIHPCIPDVGLTVQVCDIAFCWSLLSSDQHCSGLTSYPIETLIAVMNSGEADERCRWS